MNIPVKTRHTAGTGGGMAKGTEYQHRTHTCDTCDTDTAGPPTTRDQPYHQPAILFYVLHYVLYSVKLSDTVWESKKLSETRFKPIKPTRGKKTPKLSLNRVWTEIQLVQMVCISCSLVLKNPGSNRTIRFAVWPKKAETGPNQTSPTLAGWICSES